ncbi:helix-turn-helix transcriptional regulator [Epilithonimonas sp. JDS]|uniref:helix-turn-helix domain-containing protein n=1 Tax=Epilithonimonas sp. JDS TaxID=2902797 RepID=UPI001E4B7CD5|nr:helix-turn-helix transcriptional regulator [Epilithonimonas sp. JDS]MCD9853946.1 helix-turn-helix transcriptional regulator [Epilithonimonas sp. JDS]
MKKSKHNISRWLQENANLENTRRTEKMFALASRIIEMMKEQGMNRVQLAEKMGKQPSEISKILSGSHNITTSSIFAIEEALGGKDIFVVSGKKQDSKETPKYVYLEVHHFEKTSETNYQKTKIPILPDTMQIKVS